MQIAIQLDKRFKQKAKGLFGKYQFEVGVLKDGPHKMAKDKSFGLKDFAGVKARKIGRGSNQTISEVSKANRLRSATKNYLTAPFQNKKNSDILKFSKEFFRLCFGHGELRRVVNYLQAIVRNPILRKDYGSNKAKTIAIKGFNHPMIDTGQLFKAITARASKHV
jgi:hypothetical protein